MSLSEAIRLARRRHDLRETDPVVLLPAYQGRLAPLPAARRRSFTRYLAEAIAEAFADPVPAAPRTAPDLAPAQAQLAAAACACCRGHCCSRGGEHAYLDADTIRRLRRAEPGLTRAAILAGYRAALGREAYEGSCVFHGPAGCRLDRGLRSDLCNSFLCNELKVAVREPLPAGPSLLVARDGEQLRRVVLRRPDPLAAAASPAGTPPRA
jgi:hypothetical protein